MLSLVKVVHILLHAHPDLLELLLETLLDVAGAPLGKDPRLWKD